MDIKELLTLSVENNASDLHLCPGDTPLIRVEGEFIKLNYHPLSRAHIKELLFNLLSKQQQQKYKHSLELDFAFELPNVARFRGNIYHQQRGIAAAFRLLSSKILSFSELNTPAIFTKIAKFSKGLVLVTGPAGAGKTTTLAAFIDYINEHRRQHILTIEDPVEYVHCNKACLVSQREIYSDTLSFQAALRSALREDPDVILVGEMRDTETIRLALTAAETGHLVLASLHTASATQTINRIIDVFPGDEKAMVRTMLAESLRAVISQRLIKQIGGGRIAAYEVMISTSAIRNLIRENKIAQMYSTIQTGKTYGMQTLQQCLVKLEREGKIANIDSESF